MDESQFQGILADFGKRRKARTRAVEADRNRLRAINQLYETGDRLAWFPWEGPAGEAGPVAWERVFRQYVQLAKTAARIDRLRQAVDELSESNVCEGFRYAAGLVQIAVEGGKRGTIARYLKDAQAAGILEDAIRGVRAGLECLSEKTKFDLPHQRQTDNYRPCFARDHLMLKWKDEGLKPAAIRNKWNAAHPDQHVGTGEHGRDIVKKATQTARRERDRTKGS